MDQLEHLSQFRDKLRELVLTSNPLCMAFTTAPGAAPQNPAQLDYAVYQQYVSSIFPALRLLDGQPMNPLIDFDLPVALSDSAPTELPPLKESFFDSPQHQKMCFAFVSRYFELFDRDRQDRELISVYADQAVFSLQYQPEPKHSNIKYTDMNRNISTLGGAKLRTAQEISLLKQGPVAIVSALHSLPPSKHDRDSFVADVVKVPSSSAELNAAGGILHITIRGHFHETGLFGTRAQLRPLCCLLFASPSPRMTSVFHVLCSHPSRSSILVLLLLCECV